jgi:antirestriction protein ArdC
VRISTGVHTPPLRHNGVAYRGVNVLALWMQAMASGYASPIWMSFKQALALGARVRKGEKGSLVVYARHPRVEIRRWWRVSATSSTSHTIYALNSLAQL